MTTPTTAAAPAGTSGRSCSAFRCYYWFEDICPLNDCMSHEDIFAQTEGEAAYRFELRHGTKPTRVERMHNAVLMGDGTGKDA